MITEQYIGRVLDRRYRILEFIAEGGMSLLFRAVHVGTGRPLAVKILHEKFRSSSYDVRRFQREAWLTAALKHENIVDIFDVQTEEDCYLVMELLVGVDLRAHLRQHGRLPWAEVRAIILQICSALQCAHDHGVVHRDMKPANCFRLDPSGRIKVLDLGIAKPMSPLLDDHGRLTMTGAMLGTPAYMAPEQYIGQADVRTDVYSVGVLMFELMTGRRPFCGNDTNLLRQIMYSPMPALASVAEHLDCPPGVEEVIARALAKLPGDRHVSMRAFADAIAAFDAKTTTVVERATPSTFEPTDDFMDRPTIAVLPRVRVSSAEPNAEPLEGPAVAVVAKTQTPPATEEDVPAMISSIATPAAQETPATGPEAPEPPRSAAVEQPPAAPAEGLVEAPAPVLLERPLETIATPASGPPRRRAVGRVVAVAALLCAIGLVLAWRQGAPPVSSPGPEKISAGPSQSALPPTEVRLGAVEANEREPPPSLEQPIIPEPLQKTIAIGPAPLATPALDDAQPTAQPNQRPAPKPVAAAKAAAAKAAARARQKRQSRAEKAVLDVLIAEQIGALVSQVKVTVRWSATGEVTEATVDHLPRGDERKRVEARLRELPAPAGPSEPLSVEKTFALQLPE